MGTIRARGILFGYLATAVIGSLLTALLSMLLPAIGGSLSVAFARRVEDIPFVFALFTGVALVAGLPASGLLWLLRGYWLRRGILGTALLRKLLTAQTVLGVLTFLLVFSEDLGGEGSTALLLIGCYVPVGTVFLWVFAGAAAGADVDPKRVK